MPIHKPQPVLVVEDEASIASFVSLYLKNAGYDVHVAPNGEEALSTAEATQPVLIVLDLMLPDIDGIEVCRRLRRTSDVPILMLTARDEDVDKIIGLEVGADDYLTKPFNPRELVARVKSILRRATPDRREVASATLTHGRSEHRRGPARGQGRRRRHQAGPQGVRPAVGAARPPRSRPDARSAARAGLGLHLRRRHAHGRRARATAETEAGRSLADRHGLGRRLQGLASQGAGLRLEAPDVPVPPLPTAGPLPRRHRSHRPRRDGDRLRALPGLHARSRGQAAAA